jgi:hypothetical protein
MIPRQISGLGFTLKLQASANTARCHRALLYDTQFLNRWHSSHAHFQQPSKLPEEELRIYRLSDVLDGLSRLTDAADVETHNARYLEDLGSRGS